MADVDETTPLCVYRVVLLVEDHDGIGREAIQQVIQGQKYPNRCIHPDVMDMEMRSVDWHDRHPLNLLISRDDEFRRLFEGGGA